jgi:hypothetical protein
MLMMAGIASVEILKTVDIRRPEDLLIVMMTIVVDVITEVLGAVSIMRTKAGSIGRIRVDSIERTRVDSIAKKRVDLIGIVRKRAMTAVGKM